MKKPFKLLIIDDSEEILTALTNFFTQKKYDVVSAANGLEGLKQALEYRFYTFVNKQSISEETETSFIFRMNDCRVQSARKRKGLDDYPCKSAGIVEYTTFAETIDSTANGTFRLELLEKLKAINSVYYEAISVSSTSSLPDTIHKEKIWY